MELIDNIKEIASKIAKQQEHVATEEATKSAFIVPFIRALGYDDSNPLEVIPEYIADVGEKKGEKVDYAIKKDDEIIILIECKPSKQKLGKEHTTQLSRYFSEVDARLAILTNGINYKFYSDIEKQNKMDRNPFFEFNVLEFEDYQFNELKKFTKSHFSLEDILSTASFLKYTGEIKKILKEELDNPTKEFVEFFVRRIYKGNFNDKVYKEFSMIVKEARNQFVEERINERLKSAMALSKTPDIDNSLQEQIDDKNKIETTQDEIHAYNIVKAILCEVVDIDRVVMKDTQGYCGILLDNTRKIICRLYFNDSSKYQIGLFEGKYFEDKGIKTEYIKISNVSDIYNYSDRIKKVISEYD